MEQPLTLFKLPAGLRNEIYYYAVVDRDPIGITPKKILTEPDVLTTCWKVRREALPIYYRENTFRLLTHCNRDETLQPEIAWLRTLAPSRCSLLTKVSVDYYAKEGDANPYGRHPRELEQDWQTLSTGRRTEWDELVCELMIRRMERVVSLGTSPRIFDFKTPGRVFTVGEYKKMSVKILAERARRLMP